ncbi:MAG: CDP-glycerol glycerophosphotransferase family protein [Candidatus Harrisonbacteria bacterium]|nr:CDP-glycerol glycerophosphotransferase family protein [Candidatus Harrisonbacteria bacterium]
MKKTLFFSAYSTMGFRNFLVIPNGVAARLAQNKNLELVFLIPRGSNLGALIKKYNLGPNVIVEEVDTKMQKFSLIQKAFYFFYSYLIFTGTTRLLATFGARADAPPAGGNRYAAPLKSLISKTFGRSRRIKTVFVPWAYKKLFFRKELADLFEKYHPDLVFLSGIAAFEDEELLAEAQRRRVKTIGMPTNWDHLNKYYIPVHADFLLIQNEPMKKEAMEYHGYREDQIVMVGFPQFDFYVIGKEYIKPRAEVFKKYGFDPDSKLILFISGSVYALDEQDILRAIYDRAWRGEFGYPVSVMVRPYPNRADIVKYKHLEGLPGIAFFWENTSTNFENIIEFTNILRHADAVISVFSTTAIEAAIFDKPTITIGFDGYSKRPMHQSLARMEKLSHFKHVLDTGSVKVARSFEELFAQLGQYLKSPETDREQRKLLIEKMCYKMDGNSTQRIVEFINAQLSDAK